MEVEAVDPSTWGDRRQEEMSQVAPATPEVGHLKPRAKAQQLKQTGKIVGRPKKATTLVEVPEPVPVSEVYGLVVWRSHADELLSDGP